MMPAVTLKEIAPIIGVSREDIIGRRLKRNGVEPVSFRTTGGRRAEVYDFAAIAQVYGLKMPDAQEENHQTALRKERDDRGKARGIENEVLLRHACILAREEFLKSALPDARGACERAVDILKAQFLNGILKEICGEITDDDFVKITKRNEAGDLWLYKTRIIRKDKFFVGEFWTDGWKDAHNKVYHAHDSATNAPKTWYKWWKILENAGLAGEGFGFCKMIMLDDYTGENWVKKDGGQYGLPKCILVWDVLTGALLWVEECEEPSAQAYIRALMCAAWTHGLANLPIFFMENAKAAIANRVIQVVRTMYSAEDLEIIESGQYELLKKIGKGTTSPIIRNPAHIPPSMGKAVGERRMDFVNREHNPTAFPALYQPGGNRTPAQMQVSNQPIVSASTNKPSFALDKNLIPTSAEYANSLMMWAWTDYTTKFRKYLREWSAAHGRPQTIEAVIEYYRPAVKQLPPPENFAYMLYWAIPEKARTIVTVRMRGFIVPIINKRQFNLVSATIFSGDKLGRKVCVVPIPGEERKFIIMLVDDPNRPQYLGVAEDKVAETLDEVQQFQLENRHERELIQGETRDLLSTLDPAKMITAHVAQPSLLSEAPEWVAEISTNDNLKVEVIEPDVQSDGLSDEDLDAILNS